MGGRDGGMGNGGKLVGNEPLNTRVYVGGYRMSRYGSGASDSSMTRVVSRVPFPEPTTLTNKCLLSDLLRKDVQYRYYVLHSSK